MMKKLLFALLLVRSVVFSQQHPPDYDCPYANSYFNDIAGDCYQTYVLRSIYRPSGAVTDSLMVRGTGTWGVVKFIAPLRTHFSAGTGLSYNSSTGVFTNSAPDQTVSLTAGTGINVSGTYPNFTVTNSAPAVSRTINNNVSRSLNSSYTISTTRDSKVNYSINVSWTIQALLSGTATAFLEYSTNSGASWETVSQVSKSIGLLTFAGADDMNLTGDVPLNALVRIRTTSTNMTVSYTRGQEVLL